MTCHTTLASRLSRRPLALFLSVIPRHELWITISLSLWKWSVCLHRDQRCWAVRLTDLLCYNRAPPLPRPVRR